MSPAYALVAITTIISPIFLALSVAVTYIAPRVVHSLLREIVMPLVGIVIVSLIITMVFVSLNLANQGTGTGVAALVLFDLLILVSILVLLRWRDFLSELASYRRYNARAEV